MTAGKVTPRNRRRKVHPLASYVVGDYVRVKNPRDILLVVRDLTNPMITLMKDIPKRDKVYNYFYGSDMSTEISPPETQPPTPDNVLSSDAENDNEENIPVVENSEEDAGLQ